MDLQDLLQEIRTNSKLKFLLENNNHKLICNGYYTDKNGNIVLKFWEDLENE